MDVPTARSLIAHVRSPGTQGAFAGVGGFAKTASSQVTPRQAGVALGLTYLYGQVHVAARVLQRNNLTDFFLEYLVRTTYGETNVQEIGPLFSGSPSTHNHQNTYQKLHRPLIPGCSVGGKDGGAGTLGAFVDVNGGTYILSNNHVLSESSFIGDTHAKVGDLIWQPGGVDGGNPQYAVATLANWAAFNSTSANNIDCAIAAINPSLVGRISYGGRALCGFRQAIMGEDVFKVGRTTEFTRGIIDSTEMSDAWVNYRTGPAEFDDQIMIVGNNGQPFSLPGDSGSLVIAESDYKAVGLIFAGNQRGGYSIACPIIPVLKVFGASLLVTG